ELHPDLGDQPPPGPVQLIQCILGEDLVSRHPVGEHPAGPPSLVLELLPLSNPRFESACCSHNVVLDSHIVGAVGRGAGRRIPAHSSSDHPHPPTTVLSPERPP